MSLTIGIVACLHGKVTMARKFAARFKKDKVDAIVLNGDIPSDDDQYKNFCKILDIFVRTKCKVYVLPGSHEHNSDYKRALKRFKGTVVDCSKFKKFRIGGYQLVFLPGSDVLTRGGGYKLVEDSEERAEWNSMMKVHELLYGGKIAMSAISDLETINHEDPIVFCHVPPKFNGAQCIDRARFGVPTKDFILDGDLVVKGESIFTLQHTKDLKRKGAPLKIKEKNVGNPVLKKVLRKMKIKFFVCGHIHESGGKATTSTGKKLRAGSWYKELYYNASAGKEGRAGLLYLSFERVKYRNIHV